jgi:hypothetical protein
MEGELKQAFSPLLSSPRKPERVFSYKPPAKPANKPAQSQPGPQVRREKTVQSIIEGNEAAVIKDMKSVISAQAAFHKANGRYTGSLQSLTAGTPPFLGGDWSGARNGYTFTLMASPDSFRVNSDPEIPGQTGTRHFYADTIGVIRCDPVDRADKNSAPLGE